MTREDAVAAVILTASLATWAAMCSAPARAADTVPFVVSLDRPAVEVPVAFAKDAGAVIECESRWRADAVNPASGAAGLLQIHPIHRARVERMGYSWADMLHPAANVRVGLAIWREQGFAPWVCSPSGGVR